MSNSNCPSTSPEIGNGNHKEQLFAGVKIWERKINCMVYFNATRIFSGQISHVCDYTHPGLETCFI